MLSFLFILIQILVPIHIYQRSKLKALIHLIKSFSGIKRAMLLQICIKNLWNLDAIKVKSLKSDTIAASRGELNVFLWKDEHLLTTLAMGFKVKICEGNHAWFIFSCYLWWAIIIEWCILIRKPKNGDSSSYLMWLETENKLTCHL